MKALIHAPLFKFALCFALGILLSDKWGIQLALIGIPALSGFLYSVLQKGRRLSYRKESLAALCIYLIAFGLGAVRQSISSPKASGEALEAINCQQVYLMGYASSAVKTNEWGQKVWMDLIAVQKDSQWHSQKGRIQLYLNADMEAGNQLSEHDSLLVLADVVNVQSPHSGYVEYLHRHGIFYAAYVKAVEVGNPHLSLRFFSQSWQKKISERLGTLISSQQLAGIAQAMFLGEKSGLTPDARKVFSAAGLSHILAISGLHIGIIFLVLNWIWKPLHLFRFGQRIKHILVLCLLILYMLLTGAGPAVVRAVLMLAAVLIFRISYQRYHLLNLLAIAAMGQLYYDPQMLWQPGFQLSYSAVCGIVICLPIFEKWMHGEKKWINQLFSGIAVSLIATVATTPFVWTYFGQFSTYFLLANLLVSSLSFLLVFCGFLTVLFCWVPGLNELLGLCSEILLKLLYEIAHWIVQLPHATITEWRWDSPAIGIVCLQIGIALGIMLFQKLQIGNKAEQVLVS